jgi:hypothetical protein
MVFAGKNEGVEGGFELKWRCHNMSETRCIDLRN